MKNLIHFKSGLNNSIAYLSNFGISLLFYKLKAIRVEEKQEENE